MISECLFNSKLFWYLFNFSKKKMKSLLCSSKFKEQKYLLNHYVTYHNVDENNWFFQKLFQIKDKNLLKRCLRCDKFLVTEKQKAVHNFLKHYEDGKTIPFEEKPLDVLKLPALMIYSIEFRKHQNFYDFYNSELCFDDFLRNVRYRLKLVVKNDSNVNWLLKILKNLCILGYNQY